MTHPATPPTVSGPKGGPAWGKILLFGCLGLVIAGGALSAIGGGIWYLMNKDRVSEATAGTTGESVEYRSGDHRFTGTRGENAIDFSFRYPVSWSIVEDENTDSPNFVKVERSTEDAFTIENFAVGTLSGDMGGPALDLLLQHLRPQLEQGFPGSTFGDMEDVTLAGRSGRGVSFTGRFEDTPRGDIDYYGRVLLVPSSADRGVSVFALATGLADGVDGVEDVGERGELQVIFESFQFGGGGGGGAAREADAPATGASGQDITIVDADGGTYRGRLDSGDRTRDDSSIYDGYAFNGSAGERVVVTLESGDFDAYLTVLSPTQQTHDDDDSGGGTDSRLELTLEESGTWTIMANAYRAGESGEYVLTIER